MRELYKAWLQTVHCVAHTSLAELLVAGDMAPLFQVAPPPGPAPTRMPAGGG